MAKALNIDIANTYKQHINKSQSKLIEGRKLMI